jgi:hypothetical protein
MNTGRLPQRRGRAFARALVVAMLVGGGTVAQFHAASGARWRADGYIVSIPEPGPATGDDGTDPGRDPEPLPYEWQCGPAGDATPGL